jgi:hypothetical protein
MDAATVTTTLRGCTGIYDRGIGVREMCLDCRRIYEPHRPNTLIPAISPDLKPEHAVQCFSRIEFTSAPAVAHA